MRHDYLLSNHFYINMNGISIIVPKIYHLKTTFHYFSFICDNLTQQKEVSNEIYDAILGKN